MSRRDLHQAVALAGQTFRPITSADLPLIVHAVERTRAMLWAAYGPFLLSYGQSPARAVLIGGLDDALVVLLRRTVKGQDHLDLVIPPLCDQIGRAHV